MSETSEINKDVLLESREQQYTRFSKNVTVAATVIGTIGIFLLIGAPFCFGLENKKNISDLVLYIHKLHSSTIAIAITISIGLILVCYALLHIARAINEQKLFVKEADAKNKDFKDQKPKYRILGLIEAMVMILIPVIGLPIMQIYKKIRTGQSWRNSLLEYGTANAYSTAMWACIFSIFAITMATIENLDHKTLLGTIHIFGLETHGVVICALFGSLFFSTQAFMRIFISHFKEGSRCSLKLTFFTGKNADNKEAVVASRTESRTNFCLFVGALGSLCLFLGNCLPMLNQNKVAHVEVLARYIDGTQIGVKNAADIAANHHATMTYFGLFTLIGTILLIVAFLRGLHLAIRAKRNQLKEYKKEGIECLKFRDILKSYKDDPAKNKGSWI